MAPPTQRTARIRITISTGDMEKLLSSHEISGFTIVVYGRADRLARRERRLSKIAGNPSADID